MIVFAVGGDVGAEGGLALVRLAPVGLPTALGLWRLHGDDDRAWWRSAVSAAQEARGALSAAEAEACAVWVEQPGNEGGGKANVRNRVRTWDRLGLRRGLLTAALYDAGFVGVYHPQPGEWPGAWGKAPGSRTKNLIRVGKDKADGGEHRVREAGAMVVGGSRLLAIGLATGRIDRAEALLIAGAAALRARSAAVAAGMARRAS